MDEQGGQRGVSPVIGVVLLVAIVVVLAATVGVLAFNMKDTRQDPAPKVTVSYELVDDGAEKTIAITLDTGEAVETEQLYVQGSKDIDIGGPSSGVAADESYASDREKFTESSSGNPQVDIGDTWEAGETVYVDPVGDTEGTTIRIYWSARTVQGVNPGTVANDTSYRIAEFTVES